MEEKRDEKKEIRQFIIVTGMSGAGKTMTLKVLEDLGFITIDSLPPELLPQLFHLLAGKPSAVERGVVATIDVRNVDSSPALAEARDFIRVLDDIKSVSSRVRILFLTASDEELLRRYERTRRVHPLSAPAPQGRSTREGILREREILAPVLERADVVIDTSHISTARLRQELLTRFSSADEGGRMTVSVISFGFKYGLPMEADLVFDVRFMPNPFYIEDLRHQTGLDKAVSDYVFGFRQTHDFLSKLRDLLAFALPLYEEEGKTGLAIAVGCTGGHHRSVAIAHALAQGIREQGYAVTEIHRDMGRGD